MSDDLIAAHRDQPQADALSASAVPGRRRPHPRRHEPQAHARATICRWSSASAPRGPTSRSPPTSSSAFPARPRPTSRQRSTSSREVGFAQAYSFKYSPRPGTPAANMEQVPEAVKAERLARLQGLLDRAANGVQFGAASAEILPVLFEKLGPPGRASSLAVRPIFRRSTPRPRRSCSGASCRLKSRPPDPIVFPVS